LGGFVESEDNFCFYRICGVLVFEAFLAFVAFAYTFGAALGSD
jgi:hypothetical protein